MGKAPDAFRTISEVAEWLDVAPHVLRFWESKFTQVKPVKRAGGRRYYRPSDMELLGGIKVLLHDQGQTIKAVQSMIRADGIDAVAANSPSIDGTDDVIDAETVQDDNVVAFEPTAPEPETADAPHEQLALPEIKDEAEPAATPEPDPAPEPVAAAAPAPKPLIIDVPDIEADAPDYDALPVSALALSLRSKPGSLDAKADQIAPLLTRLKALRAEMTSHGAR